LTTTYTNNAAGDVAAVSYSDGTPGMANVYDQAGRLWSNFCNGITTTRSYDLANDLLVESYSGGALGGFSVTNGFDNLLRRTTVAVLSNSTPILHSSMSYDAASRLSTVSDGTNSATYFYVANSSLVDHIVFARGNTNVMTNQNTYDNLNRLTGTSSALSYNYQYNLAGQRTKVTQLIDGSYWLYVYDALGQLISAKKFFWDGTPYAGQQFGFGFDTIGNRTSTLAGGDSTGANLRQANYANNALNQITSRDVPGYVDIMGLALATNTVSVNGSNAYRKWEYFREQVPINNTNNAVWANVTVTTQTATNSGSLFVARTPENFGYDADGNQLSDGRFNYTWDAENRLISAASLAGAPAASMSSNVFAYDYMGRRIQKVVSTWNTASNAYVVSYTNKFVYDGWNVVAILDGSNNVLYTCTWGTDMSGSMQGAGGVGGLLSITVCAGSNAGTYFCCYDGNGNIVALVNAATGAVAANYEYGPFGELIRATGPMAKLNPFMFSTKFYDWESGLYYYGYRYYNPSTGRWLSRDPIEELSFRRSYLKSLKRDDSFELQSRMPDGNIYAFLQNDSIDWYDVNGLLAGPPTLPGPGTCLVATEAAATVAVGIATLPATAVVLGVVIVGEGVVITYEICTKPKPCPPLQKGCRPCIPPVGTVGGRVDSGGGHGTQGPYHLHYAKMNQIPLGTPPPARECSCFWDMNFQDPIDWPSPNLPPGMPPITPAAGGGVYFY
jgi:RHS repeat-associated protein